MLSTRAPDQYESQRKHFESQLSIIDTLDDPLSIYDTYITYLASNITTISPSKAPNSSRRISDLKSCLLHTLESSTRAFSHDPLYKNDPRFIRHWLEYTSFVKEPEDVFRFMGDEGIGQGSAAYWEAYGRCLERKAKEDTSL